MFRKIVDTGVPEFNVMAYFWQNLRDDLNLRGCLSPNILPALQGLTYKDRARMEREMLQTDALTFLDTTDFITWAELSGVDPKILREELIHECRLNS